MIAPSFETTGKCVEISEVEMKCENEMKLHQNLWLMWVWLFGEFYDLICPFFSSGN